MSVPASTSKIVQFGVFELDLQRAELRKQGVKVKLQEQPLKVLQLLLENPGQIVSREQIRTRIWPANTFVEFDQGLYSAMARLRDTLGDSSESPRFIETVARRGYRFIAPLTEIAGEERGLAKDTVPRPENYVRKLAVSVLAGLFGGALLLGLFLGFNLGGARDWLRHYGNRPIHSIAVLPLQNLSNDPQQDYFADGMTDELTTELAQVGSLRVISRTSAMQYKATKKSLPQIARELNVDAVVEGSVVRSGDRVRITAQLVDAATDQHLWAASYDRELRDVLIWESQAAQDIASEVRIKLTPTEQGHIGRAHNVNSEAFEAYLKGRYHWNKRSRDGLRKAEQYFQEAIQKDPNYAPAYAGLADTYILFANFNIAPPGQAYPRAREMASKAIQIDSTLSEAHASLATLKAIYDWDWSGAEQEFRRAIELNHNYATAHHWYAEDVLIRMGRQQEALAEIERARQLDPLSLQINAVQGRILGLTNQNDKAIEQGRKALELDPGWAAGHWWLGLAYEQSRRYPEAIVEFQRTISLSVGNSTSLGALGHAYAVSGQKTEAAKILQQLQKLPPRLSLVSAFDIALLHTGLGHNDQAFLWLGKACDERDYWIGTLAVEPRLEPLRSDPRFGDLLRRIGLGQ
jgi:TolB-like protein/DNA-binding winged helix-turn-helix (wHTH) protein/Tfp pilus assembly protein PilF